MKRINLKKYFIAAVSTGCLAVAGVQLVGASNHYDITAYCGADYGTGTYVYYANNNEYNTYQLNVEYEYFYTFIGVRESDTVSNTAFTNENNVRISATAKPERSVLKSDSCTASGYKNGSLVGSATDQY